MEDDLMRLFNSKVAEQMMSLTNFPEDQPLESKMVARSILRAQTQVEARNFEIRKNVLQYDDVMNKQREVIYAERQKVLGGEDLGDQIQDFVEDVIPSLINNSVGNSIGGSAADSGFEEDDLKSFYAELKNFYPIRVDLEELAKTEGVATLTAESITELVLEDAKSYYQEREEMIGPENMRNLERQVVLSVLDRKWREHLYDVDYLKEGIGLRAMAQKDPLVEYRSETALMFNEMNYAIREESLRFLMNIQFQPIGENPDSNSKGSGKNKQLKGAAANSGKTSGSKTLINNSGSVSGSGSVSESSGSSLSNSGGGSGSNSSSVTSSSSAAISPSDSFGNFNGSVAGSSSATSSSSANDGSASKNVAGVKNNSSDSSSGSDSNSGAPATPAAPKPGYNVKVSNARSAPVLKENTSSSSQNSNSNRAQKTTTVQHSKTYLDGATYPGTPPNSPCPCGSGKKYKLCHGRNDPNLSRNSDSPSSKSSHSNHKHGKSRRKH
jgi:preprotein translocase subunit SecA